MRSFYTKKNFKISCYFCNTRHHVYEKPGGPKSIDLKEVGPRFEMRLYKVIHISISHYRPCLRLSSALQFLLVLTCCLSDSSNQELWNKTKRRVSLSCGPTSTLPRNKGLLAHELNECGLVDDLHCSTAILVYCVPSPFTVIVASMHRVMCLVLFFPICGYSSEVYKCLWKHTQQVFSLGM